MPEVITAGGVAQHRAMASPVTLSSPDNWARFGQGLRRRGYSIHNRYIRLSGIHGQHVLLAISI
jgi:hypothetical protein